MISEKYRENGGNFEKALSKKLHFSSYSFTTSQAARMHSIFFIVLINVDSHM